SEKNRNRVLAPPADGDIEVAKPGNGISESDLVVHNVQHPRPFYAFQLSHMEERPGFPTPIGVLRSWPDLARYEDIINQQIADVRTKRGPGDLARLLRGGDTWLVEAR